MAPPLRPGWPRRRWPARRPTRPFARSLDADSITAPVRTRMLLLIWTVQLVITPGWSWAPGPAVSRACRLLQLTCEACRGRAPAREVGRRTLAAAVPHTSLMISEQHDHRTITNNTYVHLKIESQSELAQPIARPATGPPAAARSSVAHPSPTQPPLLLIKNVPS